MDSTRISRTTPQCKRATALLGKNAATMTILMYLFRVIKPMMSMKAKAIVACTDAETTHHSWLKFHVLVYKIVIQNGVLMVAMKTSVSARF